MNSGEFKEFLIYCTATNYGILLVWFGVFTIAHGWLYRLHSRWFKFSPDQFDAFQYAGMALYKIGILLFNLTPLLALLFIS
jgi:hypothetical protein